MVNNSKLTFKNNERLKLRDDIKAVFSSPNKLQQSPFLVLYKEVDEESGLKVLISAPKKRFKKAVDRNLIKRRAKEAYRLQKNEFKEVLDDSGKGLHLVLIYQSDLILPYVDFYESVGQILLRLKNKYEVSA